MPGRLTSNHFVGRQSQLAELQLAFREACDGLPGLILVGGDSGVGKTRLLAEAGEGFEGALQLRGECLEQGEAELPYAPLVGALRSLVRDRDPALDELSAASRANLSSLLPSLGEHPGDVDGRQPGTGQVRLFESLLELLHVLSEREPVALALEDVHWADSSTRTFISFLSRGLQAERVLVLITYRSDELHRRHPLRPLLAELARAPNCRRIELGPFDQGELAEALTDILGRAPEEDLVGRLHARTDGNPLYVEELLAAALDGRGAAPQSLRDAFMLRIDRLGDGAGAIVQAVAVGRALDERLIARVAGLEETAVHGPLREAIAEQILVVAPDGRLRFRHALLREAVYDDLLPGERSALHLTLARALEQAGAEDCAEDEIARVAAIAAHYAAAGEQTAALRATVRAGYEARRVHAYGEAAELAGRALELWSRVPDAAEVAGIDHVGLLEFAAAAGAVAGDMRRSEMLAERALAEIDPASDPLRYGRLLGRRARSLWRLNRASEALEEARRALELLPQEVTPERIRLLSWVARTHSLRGHYREASVEGEQALEMAEAAGLPGVVGELLNTLGMARIAMGDVEDGERLLRKAISVAREQDDMDDLGTAYSNLADMLSLAGRTGDALAVVREGLQEVRLRLGRSYGWMELTLSVLAFEAGDWKLASATDGPAISSLAGVPLIFRLLRDAELALGRGDDELAVARLDDARPLVHVTCEAQWHGLYGSLRGELWRRAGELELAQQAVAQALDELEVCTDDVMRIARVTAVGLAVEADRALRARDLREPDDEADALARIRIHVDRLEAAAQAGGPVEAAWLAVGVAEAARGRGASDPALWRSAAEAWDALQRPHCGALARWRQAEALVESDARAEAAVAAADALAVTRRLGAGWLQGELERLVARGRLEPPEHVAGGAGARDGDNPFGLTPRELQVLALIAEGASNRQIGSALYMAEKTASVHVSRILSKLDVQSRTQAAALAHRHHLN